MLRKPIQEIWKLLNKNTQLIISLGFDASAYGCWISRRKRATGEVKYYKCNLSKRIITDEDWNQVPRTSLSALLGSHIGKEPVFDSFRKCGNPKMKKRGNIVSSIRHPNMWVFDFDNHDHSADLSQKLRETYERLIQHKELLVGYSDGFNGLHVLCLTPYKCIVEQESKAYIAVGGHVDIYNHSKDNGISVPGFDHYLYHQEDVLRFIDLLNIKTEGWISIYNEKYNQKITYPEPIEISQTYLTEQKVYKDSKANVKMHLEGTKNCTIKSKPKDSDVGALEYIQGLMADQGNRTPRLLKRKSDPTNEHKKIIWALANLNIHDIETFKQQFPDFEENHYKLIEERLEYINTARNHKEVTKGNFSNTNYANAVKELQILVEQLFIDNNIKYNKRLLSVATYLTNCMDHKLTPGFIHYIEFCKMNDEEPLKERTYYDKVKECEEVGLIYIPNKKYYIVGKKCRTTLKGHLLHLLDYQRTKKTINKEYDYINVNIIYNTNLYNHNKKDLSSFLTILCTAKNANTPSFDMFDMKNFYSLRA